MVTNAKIVHCADDFKGIGEPQVPGTNPSKII